MNVYLAVDPSSTRTGWARYRLAPSSGRNAAELIDAGAIVPPSRIAGRKPDAIGRIEASCAQLAELIAVFASPAAGDAAAVRLAAVEVPGRIRRAYSAPPEYAMAVGAVLRTLWCAGIETDCIPAGTWTRMGGSYGMPKATRLRILASATDYRGEPGDDPGGDEGDARMLGLWYAPRAAERLAPRRR